MRSAIDTNILSALWSAPAEARAARDLLLDAKSLGGLVICAVVYGEVLAHPNADAATVDRFLIETGIVVDLAFSREAVHQAGRAYRAYAARRRKAGAGPARRIMGDFLIGAHALDRADRLLTFDPADYRTAFPGLTLVP
jgi:predicted nucleic acid-binding protein